MDDATQKILADLATIEAIARRPSRSNPLIAVVIEQQRALGEIEAWAHNAQVAVRPKVPAVSPADDMQKPVRLPRRKESS